MCQSVPRSTHTASVIKHNQLLLRMDENLCLYWDSYAVQKYEIFLYSSRRIQNFWMLNFVLHKVAIEPSWVNNITVECSLLLGCGTVPVNFTDVSKKSFVFRDFEEHWPRDTTSHTGRPLWMPQMPLFYYSFIYRFITTYKLTLTLSDSTSNLVRQYFPVPLQCRKTSDTVFVAFVRPLSEPVWRFSSCGTDFSQQIAQVVLFLFLRVFLF
jgi:hypothetical protein